METINDTGSWLLIDAGRVRVQEKDAGEGKLLEKSEAFSNKL